MTISSIFFQSINYSTVRKNDLLNDLGDLKVSTVLTGNWTTAEVISTESTNNSFWPSIAADSSGNVHVAWGDNTNYGGSGNDADVFYKQWNVTTASWSAIEVVSTESFGASYKPTLAVDDSGNVHIAWSDSTDNYGGSSWDTDIFYKSRNPSTGWTTTEVVSTESDHHSYDPDLALDISVNVHITWNDDKGGMGDSDDIFYKHWNATTSTWITTEKVDTESDNGSGNPVIALDASSYVHIAWHDETFIIGEGGDFDIFYKRRNPMTGTWTTTEVVSTESTGASEDPTITVDSFGNVHIAWHDNTGNVADIFYKILNSTTSSWSTTEVVSSESGVSSWSPTMKLDGFNNLHIAWSGWGIGYKYKDSTSGNWTISRNICRETIGIGSSNYPTLTVDSSEQLHIAWHFNGNYSDSGDDLDILYKRFISSPLNPSIMINNGGLTTNSITVNLTLSAELAEEMRFRNGTMGTWTGWESYNTTKQLYLEGSVNNTAYSIYIQFRNGTGVTAPLGDSILYQVFAPSNPSIIINNGDARTQSTLVNLSLSADGADEMSFRNGTMGSWTSWESYDTTKHLHLEGSVNNTVYSIYAQFRNATGTTSPVGDDILYILFAPSNPLIIINNGDISTQSTLVSLTLSADGADEMSFRNGTMGSWTNWESYDTTKHLHLEGSVNNTLYSIYAQFRNATGTTTPVEDSILYIVFAPSNLFISINNGASSTNSTEVTLTISADGADEMRFRNGTTGSWTTWESYDTTKQMYLEGSVNNTVYSIYVQFRNATGTTVPVGDSILYYVTDDGDNGDNGDDEPGIPGYNLFFLIGILFAIAIILNKRLKKSL